MSDSLRLIAASFTPFSDDGHLRTEAIGPMAERLAEAAVDGVFIGGTTGECSSLAVDEREALAEAWMEAAPPLGLEVIVHVGHNSHQDAARLARHAQRIGADAVAAHAPAYLRPSSLDGLVDFLEPVARAASDLPFYYYDIPSLTGVRLPASRLLHEGKARLPNLAGLKFSHSDLMELQCCLAAGDEFEILFGSDEMLLAAVALGVHGAVGSTYNLAAPLYRAMLQADAQGDRGTARRMQWQSVRLVQLLLPYGVIPAGKAILSCSGIPCGAPRPPLRGLTPVEMAEVAAAWDAFQQSSDGALRSVGAAALAPSPHPASLPNRA